jgi:hypothetical protein
MKYVIAILFYVSIGMTIGSFIGWNLIKVESDFMLGAIGVGSVSIVSIVTYLIARQAFPYLKFDLPVVFLSVCGSMAASGYFVMANKNLLAILVVVGLPCSIFFACVLVLMVTLGVEPNKKNAFVKLPEVVSVTEKEVVKQGPAKKKNFATMLRGVEEIRQYTGAKEKQSETEE